MVLLPSLNRRMRKDIADGVFAEIMPPIKDLAVHYDVGESTMKLALKRLKEDGFLSGHQGKCIKVDPVALNNPLFRRNIILYISLPRLGLKLYTVIIESLRRSFETSGADVHLINSIRQLELCRFEIDLLIVSETEEEDLKYILDRYPLDMIIMLNRDVPGASCVGTDNRLAGANAMALLHGEMGHDRIGLLGVDFDCGFSHGRLRLDGALEYCSRHPDVRLTVADNAKFSDTAEAVAYLYDCDPKLTAVFATMDLLALGVYGYAAGKNISIPGELAVLGFDNQPFCRFMTPGLTTYQEDAEAISEELLRIAENKLNDYSSYGRKLFCPALKKRDSLGG